MKKRILAMLLALLLLCALVACHKAPPPNDGTAPDVPSDPSQPEAPEAPAEEEGPWDADQHLQQKGYPLGYTILFVGEGGVTIDTANAQIVKNGVPKGYDFTSKLASLYYEMCEHDLYIICEQGAADLTYKAFSGSEPQGENERYTLTFTDDGKTYTVVTDKAALQSYAYLSTVGNMASLITSWTNLANHLYA